MRFLTATTCTLLSAAIGTWFFPWWVIAIAAAATALFIRQQPGRAFLSGFSGIFLLWLGWGIIVSANNSFLLLGKMAQLFHLPYSWLYLLLSSLTGGIAGGLAAWSISLMLTKSRH